MQHTKEITTRNLTDFEIKLAEQLSLQKRAVAAAQTTEASPVKNQIAAAKKNRYTMGQNPMLGNKSQRAQLITSPVVTESRQAGRRNLGSLATQKPMAQKNKNFSLPKIQNTASQKDLNETN